MPSAEKDKGWAWWSKQASPFVPTAALYTDTQTARAKKLGPSPRERTEADCWAPQLVLIWSCSRIQKTCIRVSFNDYLRCKHYSLEVVECWPCGCNWFQIMDQTVCLPLGVQWSGVQHDSHYWDAWPWDTMALCWISACLPGQQTLSMCSISQDWFRV